MDVCILNQDGEIRLPRHMKASPATFLKAITPYREAMFVAVECIFTWYWLAALGAPAGIPVVLGPALSMQALHGGKAHNDKIDAHKMACVAPRGQAPAGLRLSG
jgi:hypothetical protein